MELYFWSNGLLKKSEVHGTFQDEMGWSRLETGASASDFGASTASFNRSRRVILTSAEAAAFEEGLKGAGEDFAPTLPGRQLLRISDQPP